MNTQYDHKIISSLLLFIDHELQRQGQAFTNYSGQFFPVANNIQGAYTYSLPFKQICYDTSISGAIVTTGVYLNGNFVHIGQSGLMAINYTQGAAYFNAPLPANTIVSGGYGLKDFSIELTDQPEYKLLYETKYVSNNIYNQTLSGLPLDTRTSPIIFVKVTDSQNNPFGFLRLDDNTIKVRLLVIADNEFQRIGAINILKNLNYRKIPIYSSLPLDANGSYTGTAFNYTGLPLDTTNEPWILSSRAITVPSNIDGGLNPTKNIALVDMRVSTVMQHP